MQGSRRASSAASRVRYWIKIFLYCRTAPLLPDGGWGDAKPSGQLLGGAQSHPLHACPDFPCGSIGDGAKGRAGGRRHALHLPESPVGFSLNELSSPYRSHSAQRAGTGARRGVRPLRPSSGDGACGALCAARGQARRRGGH